jgi:hypothetical protein
MSVSRLLAAADDADAAGFALLLALALALPLPLDAEAFLPSEADARLLHRICARSAKNTQQTKTRAYSAKYRAYSEPNRGSVRRRICSQVQARAPDNLVHLLQLSEGLDLQLLHQLFREISHAADVLLFERVLVILTFVE